MIAPIREREEASLERRSSPGVRRAHLWVVNTFLRVPGPQPCEAAVIRRAWSATCWIVLVAAAYAWHLLAGLFPN